MMHTVRDTAPGDPATQVSDLRTKLEYQVQSIDRKAGMRKRELLQSLLDESSKYEGKDMDKVKLLLDLAAKLSLLQPKIKTIAAGDIDAKFLVEFFGLRMTSDNQPFPWNLNRPIEEMVEVPHLFRLNMSNFSKAKYDPGSEASCRIQIDYLIIACRLAHLDRYPAPPDTGQSSTPPLQKSTTNLGRPLPLIIYPEMDLTVDVEDRRPNTRNGHLRITGKADWAFGDGSRQDSGTGTMLIAVEAKKPETIGLARNQLLTYLAIMKTLRFQERKMNEFVQGFYSDGRRYCFVSINSDNYVYETMQYDCKFPQHMKTIFNWVLDMMTSATKSSPSTNPAKPGKEENDELSDFHENVFLRMYKPYNDLQDDLVMDLDDATMEIDEFY